MGCRRTEPFQVRQRTTGERSLVGQVHFSYTGEAPFRFLCQALQDYDLHIRWQVGPEAARSRHRLLDMLQNSRHR